jgi:hypothetical protein
MDRRQLDILIRILGTAVGKKYMFADHLGWNYIDTFEVN